MLFQLTEWQTLHTLYLLLKCLIIKSLYHVGNHFILKLFLPDILHKLLKLKYSLSVVVVGGGGGGGGLGYKADRGVQSEIFCYDTFVRMHFKIQDSRFKIQDSRFKKIQEDSRFKIQEDSRRFKKIQEDSRRFKKIQEDSRRFKKIQEIYLPTKVVYN